MEGITAGSVVVVVCREPREKLWGMLLRIDALGIVLRGIELGGFEDWLRQEARGEEQLMGPSTLFLPMHRIQRIDLDEDRGPVPAMATRFHQSCGRPPAEALEE